MKNYIKWLVNSFFGLLVICTIFICYYTIITPINFNHSMYFGIFRYEKEVTGRIIDHRMNRALEDWGFAYEFKLPYLYSYGVSGYTKINIIPIITSVEKVVNQNYYNYLSRPDGEGYYSTSFEGLTNKYGNQIRFKQSLKEVSENDQFVYYQLKEKGEEEKKRFFANERTPYHILHGNVEVIQAGLENL